MISPLSACSMLCTEAGALTAVQHVRVQHAQPSNRYYRAEVPATFERCSRTPPAATWWRFQNLSTRTSSRRRYRTVSRSPRCSLRSTRTPSLRARSDLIAQW